MAWLSGWQYRRKVKISGSTGAGTNYQVPFKVGESSGATGYDFHVNGHSANFPSTKNDGGDLRFTADDGITLLNFWVESVSGTTPNRVAYVWVKVSANLDTDQYIYCYYGNPNATNASNGFNTFDWYEDFSSDRSSQYTKLGTPTITWDTANKRLIIYGGGEIQYYPTNLSKSTNFHFKLTGAYGYQSGTDYLIFGPCYRLSNASNLFYFRGRYPASSGYTPSWFKRVGGTDTLIQGGSNTPVFGTEIYEVWLYGDSHQVKISDGYTVTWTRTDSALNTNTQIGIYTLIATASSYVYIYELIVRKYVSPEPAFSSAEAEEILALARSFGYVF
jgi:hypothetical protein